MKKRFITAMIVCLILGFALAGHAKVIYETTFDDVTELDNWTDGGWTVVDGTLQNNVPGAVYIDLTAVTLPKNEFRVEFDTRVELDSLHPCCVISFYLPWSNHFRPTSEEGDPPARFAVHNKTVNDCVVVDEKFFAYIDPNVWHHFTVVREKIWYEVYLDDDTEPVYEAQVNCNPKNAHFGFASSEGSISKFDNLVIASITSIQLHNRHNLSIIHKSGGVLDGG